MCIAGTCTSFSVKQDNTSFFSLLLRMLSRGSCYRESKPRAVLSTVIKYS